MEMIREQQLKVVEEFLREAVDTGKKQRNITGRDERDFGNFIQGGRAVSIVIENITKQYADFYLKKCFRFMYRTGAL